MSMDEPKIGRLEYRLNRSVSADLCAFALDVFGQEGYFIDVRPPLSDLVWLREQGEYFANVQAARIGEERACYMNASTYVDAFPGSLYVQGFVMDHEVVYGHSWCVDPTGRAIELTWPKAEGIYFGVKLTRLQLSRLHVEYGTYDWYEGIAASGYV